MGNADGTADDSFASCSGTNVLVTAKLTDSCAADPCTDGECCAVQPKCGDTNGDGTTDDAFASCDAGFLYDSTKAATACTASPCTSSECCKAAPKCGDTNADGTSDDSFTCGAGFLYDSTKAATACSANPCTDAECCKKGATTTTIAGATKNTNNNTPQDVDASVRATALFAVGLLTASYMM